MRFSLHCALLAGAALVLAASSALAQPNYPGYGYGSRATVAAPGTRVVVDTNPRAYVPYPVPVYVRQPVPVYVPQPVPVPVPQPVPVYAPAATVVRAPFTRVVVGG